MNIICLLLCVAAYTVVGCGIRESQRETLGGLLRTMLYSITADNPPNPSVFIALRLARDHNLEKETQLFHSLETELARKLNEAQEIPSGLLALYVLAFRATCRDPQHFEAGVVSKNLLEILARKLDAEIESIHRRSVPLTNYYQVALDVLALCINKHAVPSCAISEIKKAITDNLFMHGERFDVDTAAVSVLALQCFSPNPHGVQSVLHQILREADQNGTIGNIYSTGLAVQALSVSQDMIPDNRWDCSLSIDRLLKASREGEFANPQTASQVTPSLEGKSYLNVGEITCKDDISNLTLPELTTAPPTLSPPARIEVSLNVTDGVNGSFSDQTLVQVSSGSSLLEALRVARKLLPLRFSFDYQTSSYGPYLTTVQGLEASVADRTYWQLLSGSDPLQQGIADYTVQDGEKILIILTQY
uniref:Transcobalamin 1 n=1 Tax=Leucoraja erinaceus TaxID=7782 RepID=A0A0B4UD87_LEUER|nr:transcobalamin 1 [Leucoraja erinacea]